MNGEIIAGAIAVGTIGGEVIDYAASVYAARKAKAPEGLEVDESIAIPGLDLKTTEVESKLTRARRFIGPYVTHLAFSGAAIGLSSAMLFSPNSEVHVQTHENVGVVVDNSANVLGNYNGSDAQLAIDRYFKVLSDDPSLKLTSFITDQSSVQPATKEQVLAAQPLGSADFVQGVNDALTGDKAAIVLTADTQIGPSPSLSNLSEDVTNAGASAERVIIINVEQKFTNSPVDQQLEALAHDTGGQYFDASNTSPTDVLKTAEKIILPSNSQITEHFKSDKTFWAIALGMSIGALGIGAITRSRDVIGREFKRNKIRRS